MVKTIIFDLSEVYLHGLLGVHERLSQRLNLSVKENDLHIPELTSLFHGLISEKMYLRALLKKHNWTINMAEFKSLIRENFKEISGVRKIIERLKERGYRLGLLSVHAKEWIAHCEREFDYHKLFDSVMYSFEVGICKPERRAYELILEKLNSKPEECLFIDDSINNLKVAKELGIAIIQFQSVEQLESDLRKIGIYV